MKEIWHIDNVMQECGWFTRATLVNNHYGCLHPDQEELDEEDLEFLRQRGVQGPPPFHCGRCHTWSCPLGAELNPAEEELDAAAVQALGEDPSCMSDGEWLLVDVMDGMLVGAAPDDDTFEVKG